MAFQFKFKAQNIRKWWKAIIGVFNFLTYKAFFLFLIFIIIDLLLGVLIFYHYAVFSEETIEAQRTSLELDRELLEQSLQRMQEDQQCTFSGSEKQKRPLGGIL